MEKYLMLKTNTIKNFLMFKMKCIIDGGCIFDD